ncbi:MAG: anti-sigma factor, partial [Caldilineaceae bacterium]|nr:anti-sigma factor [Caldilineaceae bacterium]
GRPFTETQEPVAVNAAAGITPASPDGFADEDSFAQVMEGYASTQQLSDNPLLMRKAPQAYVDQQTGQRFVVPRRGTLGPPTAEREVLGQRRRRTGWRIIWGLLSLATVGAVLLIAAYQRNLQQQLITTQALVADVQAQMAVVSRANRALSLRAEDPTLQGTLLIRGQQALLSISGLQPLPRAQHYQLWLRTGDGNYRAAAVLPLEQAQATHWFFVELPTDSVQVIGAGVSIEAGTGSAQPTLPMVVESGS